MWNVTFDMWHVTSNKWHVTCHKRHIPCYTWHVTHGMWHVLCVIWHVIQDMWHVTCLVGCFWFFGCIFQIFNLKKSKIKKCIHNPRIRSFAIFLRFRCLLFLVARFFYFTFEEKKVLKNFFKGEHFFRKWNKKSSSKLWDNLASCNAAFLYKVFYNVFFLYWYEM